MQRLQILSQTLISSSATTPKYEKVETELRDNGTVGVIYLNSPKDLNALSQKMFADIAAAMLEHQLNPAVKVIVLLSKVPKAFCAGADIKSFTNVSFRSGLVQDIFRAFYDSFKSITKPIICGVNSIAFGGGLELAMLCDIIYLGDSARIALPEINLGIFPGMGGTQKLKELVGKNLAVKYTMTGEPIPIEVIKNLGTIPVFPKEQLEKEVFKLASTMASKSQSALIVIKNCINASRDLPLTQGIEYERSMFFPVMDSEGAKEGVSAFIQKRKADFTGK